MYNVHRYSYTVKLVTRKQTRSSQKKMQKLIKPKTTVICWPEICSYEYIIHVIYIRDSLCESILHKTATIIFYFILQTSLLRYSHSTE